MIEEINKSFENQINKMVNQYRAGEVENLVNSAELFANWVKVKLCEKEDVNEGL